MVENEMHVPVMKKQMLQYIEPRDGEVYVDATFGAGGYSRALLEAADCKVYAIDRDPNVMDVAMGLCEEFPGRFEILQGCFADMADLLLDVGVSRVDAVVLDVGVSSMQIDMAERGFSFMRDGPLDMRMSGEGMDAAYVVNNTSEKELADIIYRYGGEKKSRYVAKAIVESREKKQITTTTQLAALVRSVVHASKDKIDPATRTFQALRIWVNDELGQLKKVLQAVEKLLVVGGRLVVVTFHSLEDAIVKEFMNEKSGKVGGVSRHMPVPVDKVVQATFKLLTRKAILPEDSEVAVNIRARSAKLRAGCKVADMEEVVV